MKVYRHALVLRTVLFALLLPCSALVRAAHYSGGDITYQCLGANNYLVTLNLYRDCSGFNMVPQTLTFSNDCGLSFSVNAIPVPPGNEVSQLCPAQLANSSCNGGPLPGIDHYQFSTTVFLPPCDDWTISWNICCWNTSQNVVATPTMYLEATLDNVTSACNNSPVYNDQSIPYVCVNQPVFYNYGVTEPDGDSLVFSLVGAQYWAAGPLPIAYQAGFSGAAPIPGAVLDPVTGQLNFTPTLLGNYIVAVQVTEYDAAGQVIGTTLREQLFIVINCTGSPPAAAAIGNNTAGLITGSNSIQVCDGQAFCVDLVFSDPDPFTVLQVTSNALSLLPGASFTLAGTNPITATLCWTGDVNNSPVNVLVEANDGACPVMNIAGSSINVVSVSAGGPLPDPGLDATVALCTNAAPVNLFTLLAGTPDPGGSWLDPGGASSAAMFDPAVDPFGVYTYVVGNACSSAQAEVTITLQTAPQAGTNGSVSVCQSIAAFLLIPYLGGSPMAGGSWTGPGGAPHAPIYDPLVDASGVYTYTVTGVGPCGSASATVTVTENAAPNAGADGAITLCSTSAATNLFASLAGAQAGGTWTAPGGAAFSGTYDPAVNASGLYTYTVNGTAPCANDQAIVTVTENAAPNAGADGAITLCSTSAATNLFASLAGAQAGGTWTAPGGVAFSGTYDPAVNTAGVYTYTVNGTAPCANDQAIVTVTENAAPNAGADGTMAICSSGSQQSLIAFLGGFPASGGTWTAPGGGAFSGTYDPASDASGVYTYTVNGTAPCANDQAIVTVTENAAPNAGIDGMITLCSSSGATNLFASLAGAQAGGTWTAPGGAAFSGTYDPAVNASGVYTYTVNGTAPCANDQAIVTVTENAAPNAGADGSITLCSNNVATDLFTSLIGAQAGGTWTAPGGGAFSGTYDPAIDASGVYTYTVNGTAPCANDQAIVTVTENAAPNAGADGSLTFCSTSAATNLFASLAGAQAGGTWTAPGGAAFSGTYDPALNTAGVYTYTVNGTAPCANDQAIVTVTENAAPNAAIAYGGSPYCSNGTPAAVTFAGTTGGIFTSTAGLSINAATGTIDPSASAAGAYNVTYTIAAGAGCAAFATNAPVSIVAAPFAGVDAAVVVCDIGATVALFPLLGPGAQAAGSWTAPGGAPHSGIYDPAVDASGVFTYTVAGAAPCAGDAATITVAETGSPFAGSDAAVSLCSDNGAAALITYLGGADPGGAWTAPGGAPHNGSFDPLIDPAGVYTYSITATPPCLGDQATVTVSVAIAPDAGIDGNMAFCASGAPAALFASLGGSPDAGGTWTAPGGTAHTGVYDPANDTPGVYTYTLNGTALCVSDQSTVNVTETIAPNAGVDGSITLCSAAAATSLFIQLTAADPGGSWTAPGGAPHSGTLDPSIDPGGTYTYSIAAMAPCMGDQSVVAVTIDPQPDAGADAGVQVCVSDPAFNLFAQLGGGPDPGGAWTDPLGNASSGVFDPALSPAGAYLYSVAGGGCPPDQSIVTVSVISGPNAGAPNAVALCDNGPIVDLTGLLAGSPDASGQWTDPGGNAIINLFDPAIGTSGAYTYTVNGAGSCPTAQAVLTLSVNNAPNAGVNGALSLCANSAAALIFPVLGATANAGGSWTAPGGGAFSGTFDPGIDPAGVYMYMVAGLPPCASASATVTVTVNPQADAGVDGSAALCSTDASTSLFNLLGGAPQSGGTWTDPLGNASAGVFDPSLSTPGAYTYDLAAIGSCPGDQSQVLMAVSTALSAGTNGAITVCDNVAAFDLFNLLGGSPATGGTWFDTGGNAVTNLFDPAVDPAGAYTYTVSAAAPCPQQQAVVNVAVIPVPAPTIEWAATTGCAPLMAAFTSDWPGGGSILWEFGNGSTSNALEPDSVLYDLPGTYVVTLNIDPGFGCASATAIASPVEVGAPPVAAFTSAPAIITTADPTVHFNNQSLDANAWFWDFDGLGISMEEHPSFDFPIDEEGVYQVCLTAYSAPTCFDTVCTLINVLLGPTIHVPNTFTPDGDGVNDDFGPSVLGITSYVFRIYDRWGRVLFESTDPAMRWGGLFAGGDPAPQGVYVWKLRADDPFTTERIERIGHVTLLR